MSALEPYSLSAINEGLVLRGGDNPDVWMQTSGGVWIDDRFWSAEDRPSVIAWLRAAADAIEATS